MQRHLITIWEDSKLSVRAAVLRDELGGLRFRYNPVHHCNGTCEYSLWCEVGEMYRKYFKEFHHMFRILDEPITYTDRPYVADQCEKIPQ